jgi:Flp pilus assembly protein TadG
MKARLSNRLRSFWKDRRGTTSILFASGLLSAVVITAAAVDYSTAVTTRTRLQAGVDSAALAAAKLGAQNPSAYISSDSALKTAAQAYLTANGPANSTISDFHACLVTGGDCTTASGTTLQVGQFYTQGTTTYTPLFNNISWLPGSSSQTLSSSATAGANLQWPSQITLNLIGAKGWYYKTVTLYALPYESGSPASSYSSLATWTYQPINLNTASGSYNVTVGSDPANGMTGLKLGSLGSGYGTLTGPTSVSLGQYADFFLVESVMEGPCSPATPWMPGNWSSNTWAFPGACYATQSAAQSAVASTIQANCGSAPSRSSRNYQSELTTYNNCVATYTPVQESVGWNICSESELNQGSNPAYSSYNSICNPYSGSNASYNSSNSQPWQFIFVNFLPTESYSNANAFSTSALVQLTSGSAPTTLFPCGQTVGHEWEDGGSIVGTSFSTALSSAENASTTPQQDFFYTVSTTCGPEPGVTASGYYSSQTAQYGLGPQLVQ